MIITSDTLFQTVFVDSINIFVSYGLLMCFNCYRERHTYMKLFIVNLHTSLFIDIF